MLKLVTSWPQTPRLSFNEGGILCPVVKPILKICESGFVSEEVKLDLLLAIEVFSRKANIK